MKTNAFQLLIFLTFLLFSSFPSNTQSTLWEYDHSFENVNKEDLKTKALPTTYKTVKLNNLDVLDDILLKAPKRFSKDAHRQKVILPLPFPNGRIVEFEIQHSPVMEPELSASFPQIRTYTGISTNGLRHKAKITQTPHGIFVMIRGSQEGTIYVQPLELLEGIYYSYYSKDITQEVNNHQCELHEDHAKKEINEDAFLTSRSGDCQLRQYRLALACTGEYAQFYNDEDDSNGDIISDAFSNMVIMVNQVNGIYEQDLGITFIIVNGNNQLIFTDPNTDPYTNNSTSAMLDENAETCENLIGDDNYDIGHVFALGGGGRAFLRSVCGNNKAKGVSKADGPLGDQADIKTAAHELGHQFGASHTQNNDCQRANSSSYEPGSGSTIMGYAGICPPQVQSFSDLYFHTKSIESIGDFVVSNGNACATLLTSENQPPFVEAGPNYTIPISTPFILQGEANDEDGDPLSYTWEQYDREFAPMPPQSTNRFGPLFRSFLPTPEPIRYFPSLEVLAGINNDRWEVLPSIKRTMKFRLTARDLNDRFGCPVEDELRVFVDDKGGPFTVTYPTRDTIWTTGESETITWDVAGTDQSPFDCNNVSIYYSTDGGLTFPNLIAEDVPNTGSYEIIVPDESSAFIRIMIKCSENIFFTTSQGYVSIGQREVCKKFYAGDTPIELSPDSAFIITSVIDIPIEENITNLKVIDILGTHSYIGEVLFTLLDPSGNETLLLGQKCGAFEDFDISFAEGAERFACPLDDGEFTDPAESLLPYLGTNTKGLWGLKIEDIFAGDGGELTTWGMEVCYTENLISSIKDVDNAFNFSLYPNPASDILNVEFNYEKKLKGSILIYNNQGQIMSELPIDNLNDADSKTIDLASWSPGLYFVRIMDIQGQQGIRKFIKY